MMNNGGSIDVERSQKWMTPIKALILLVTIPFIALNVWAYLPYRVQSVSHFFAIPFQELADVIPTHRFVAVIGTDLMLGWALTSILVVMTERSMGHSWWRVLLWVLPLNFLGNVILALYLLLYLERFRDRLLPPDRTDAAHVDHMKAM